MPKPSRRLAVVLGNDTYAGSPLRNPRNGARVMAQGLRALSFDVTTVEDGTRVSISSAMLTFSRRLTESDLALVFYGGTRSPGGGPLNGRGIEAVRQAGV